MNPKGRGKPSTAKYVGKEICAQIGSNSEQNNCPEDAVRSIPYFLDRVDKKESIYD